MGSIPTGGTQFAYKKYLSGYFFMSNRTRAVKRYVKTQRFTDYINTKIDWEYLSEVVSLRDNKENPLSFDQIAEKKQRSRTAVREAYYRAKRLGVK